MSFKIRQVSGKLSPTERHPSKEMLLPMADRYVLNISLANHLALAACEKGQGNAHLLNELMKVVYLTFYLQVAGFGDVPVDLYRRAERMLEDAGISGRRDGLWYVPDEASAVLAGILLLHDRQLAEATVWRVMEAKRRLSRFIESDRESPFPSVRSSLQ